LITNNNKSSIIELLLKKIYVYCQFTLLNLREWVKFSRTIVCYTWNGINENKQIKENMYRQSTVETT